MNKDENMVEMDGYDDYLWDCYVIIPSYIFTHFVIQQTQKNVVNFVSDGLLFENFI